MKTETDFEGNWDDTCHFCGKPQREHRQTEGPINDTIYEYRMPCQPEKDAMRRNTRKIVKTTKAFVLVIWVLIPLALLLITLIPLFGWIAFAISLGTLAFEVFKIYSDADKWIPGHKQKEEELKQRHYIYHCERNPEGFARLRAENFRKMLEEKESRTTASTVRDARNECASGEA